MIRSPHDGEGFHAEFDNLPRAQRARRQWDRLRDFLFRGNSTEAQFDRVNTDGHYLRTNQTEPTITWLGHSTFLLQIAGINILTDPHLSRRASPLGFIGPKRVMPSALTLEALPFIHAVVISHDHYDHLDSQSIRVLIRQRRAQPRFFVPLGMKSWLRGAGYAKCVELDWWQWSQTFGLTFHFVPARHRGARAPWDTRQTLAGGWIIDHPSFRFYFAGDTGYSPEFQKIGRRFGPIDLAAIPIGGYEPRASMRDSHVNPEEAVRIHQDVRARHSVAMHWGTFALSSEPLDEPLSRLAYAREAAGLREKEFFVMRHGETRSLTQFMGVPGEALAGVERSGALAQPESY